VARVAVQVAARIAGRVAVRIAMRLAVRSGRQPYFTATGITGAPTPRVKGSGEAVRKNS
jgi:hypothetical protein